MIYTEKTFNTPEIAGISARTIDEHKKLYAGYVKHTNLILEQIAEMAKKSEPTPAETYAINEMQRRLGFEFNGLRNHEYYFEQLEGGQQKADMNGKLTAQMITDFGSVEAWLADFKRIAMTRGIGWAVLYYDKLNNRLLNTWVDEQHLGQLNGLAFIYGLDMWEHSYMLDYAPSEKKKYVDAYLAATNQTVCDKRFEACL